ncbi:MAG: hypothetical protein CMF23_12440 [Ignavibacteriae bacterium]|nr:hypothetical protein [Ignavibacteriota bacterium]
MQNLYSQNPEWISYSSGKIIRATAIEGDSIWVGTNGGLVKLNKLTGETIFYNKSNSGLPDNDVISIAIDESGNKWIGTYGGLAKYDGTNWEVYKTSNSGLPGNDVRSIAIDESGNKWIGTIGGGLAVFNEGGVVSVEDKKQTILPQNFLLSQNYPNPFNPTTSIEYSIPNVETLRATSQMQNVSLKVFDILGREVAELVNEQKSAGRYKVNFNACNLSSGIYLYQLKSGNHVSSMKMLLIK